MQALASQQCLTGRLCSALQQPHSCHSRSVFRGARSGLSRWASRSRMVQIDDAWHVGAQVNNSPFRRRWTARLPIKNDTGASETRWIPFPALALASRRHSCMHVCSLSVLLPLLLQPWSLPACRFPASQSVHDWLFTGQTITYTPRSVTMSPRGLVLFWQ